MTAAQPSGQLKTLDCAFELDSDTGEQVGELVSVGQLVPDGNGGLRIARAWHLNLVNGKPIYPCPRRTQRGLQL